MSLPDPSGLGLPELGGRLRLVGQLPTTVIVLVVLALVLSGAPGSDPSWARLVSSVEGFGVEDVAWLAVGVVVVTVLLHPLQRGMVRLLEGYPLLRGPGALLGRPLLWWWGRRHDRLTEAQQKVEPSAEDEKAMKRAAARLRRLPQRHRLMPTRLGNVLRAAEDDARSRYGLDTVVIWPMLYPLLPDRLVAALEDARNQLDLGARFCCSLLLAAVVCTALLVRSAWAFPVVGGLLLLAVLSYRGAVVAAAGYGELINAAVVLHRFDLLRSLHLPLPATPAEERTANRRLVRLIRNRMPDETTTYVHPQE